MSSDRPAQDLPAMRGRADQLREAIASGVAQLRRDAAEIVPAVGPAGAPHEKASTRRVPAWAAAAAAGIIAGLVTALRRRRKSVGS